MGWYGCQWLTPKIDGWFMLVHIGFPTERTLKQGVAVIYGASLLASNILEWAVPLYHRLGHSMPFSISVRTWPRAKIQDLSGQVTVIL